MSTTVYKTVCEGQGDARITLIDKETWDWIHNPHSSPPSGLVSRVKATEGEDFEMPDITSGSAVNDAVLWAPGIMIGGQVAQWYGDILDETESCNSFVKVHGLTIVDTFEGYIY